MGMARNSLLAYGSDLKQFFEWFDKSGLLSLNAIDLKMLSGYLAHLHERGLSSTTVARHLVAQGWQRNLPGTGWGRQQPREEW